MSGAKPTLASVIERYTDSQLGRKMIHCPLHDDLDPSCSCDWNRELWHCHSCGQGGDSWSMIMLIEDCDFKTAVSLAKKYGLELNDGSSSLTYSSSESRFRTMPERGRDGNRQRYRPKFRRGP